MDDNVNYLPGFDGKIMADQLDDDRLVLCVKGARSDFTVPATIIKRSDYDCDQSFQMEVLQWARRHQHLAVQP